MVLRNGEWQKVSSNILVHGDIIKLKVGEKVPADIRITKIFTTTLKVDQSMLTGESNPVYKISHSINCNDDSKIHDKDNIIFSSTTISHGTAQGVVVSIGMATEIGTIQKQLKVAEEEEKLSPLKQKLDDFGKYLSIIITFICILVWVMNIRHFWDEIHGEWYIGCI